MAANPFDQFDTPAPGTAATANPFDQFDAKTSAPAPAQPTTDPAPSTAWQSFKQGMKDPLTGLGQLAEHILPERFNEANHEFNNWLHKYAPHLIQEVPTTNAAGAPVKGSAAFDELARNEDRQLAAQREAAGEKGVDWYRIAGNIASPTTLATPGLGAAGKGATLAARTAKGAVQGAAQAATAPVAGDGDYWTEKGKQATTGAAVGGAMSALTGAAARIIKPITSEAAQKLTKAGVSLTPGQILGGWWQRAEDAATSIPLVGDAIKVAQRRGHQTFNTAVLNEALATIGEKLPSKLQSGHAAVQHVRETLGNAYDDLLPKLKGDLHAAHTVMEDGKTHITLKTELDAIRKMGENLPEQQQQDLNRIIDQEVLSKFNEHGLASGKALKDIQEKLNAESTNFATGGPYERTLAGGIKEVNAAVRRMIKEANPEHAAQLDKINKGYALFKRAQRAAGSVAAPEGTFTPAQYLNAIKALDKTKDKRAFSEGAAVGQGLAQAGKSVLSQTVPDSGTAMREIMTGSGGLAAGATLGGIYGAGAALAAPVLYSRAGTDLMRKLLTARPQSAQPIANAVRQSAPLLTGATAMPISQLMAGAQNQ